MNTAVPYTYPQYELDGFNCPHCHAYSKMFWSDARAYWNTAMPSIVDNVDLARCNRCSELSIWYEEKMIFPEINMVEPPVVDLPVNVKKDYEEAASILQKSPRGSAALLRLSIQKLCDNLVEGNADLNTKIGILVKRGLDKRIQKALDIVRVVGNEAVHPGQIDLNDQPETALQLFKLVNLIALKMITEPNEIEEMYRALPESKKQGIEDRDK